ncbi:hypothetical protein RDI58_020465 [Solanum bulbocastanum]|uniref:N-acetyltransferase domain-containing protein n=1 Tax=Solanum bulbocastanum TaxID=147425 RepID=A0AAN8T777_SOLBU
MTMLSSPERYTQGFKPVLTTFDLKFPVVAEGELEEFRSKYDDKSDAYIAGESYRKLGMGSLLFGTVASIAANNGFLSAEGVIAVWNKKSYDFYINMGVGIFDEFTYGKLHGENLQNPFNISFISFLSNLTKYFLMAPAPQQPTPSPSESITTDASSENNNVTITGKIYTRVRLAKKSDLSHIYQLFYQIHVYHNYTHLYKATESSLEGLLFKENPLPLFYGPSVLLLEVSPTPFNEPKNTANEGFKPVLTTFDLKFLVVEGQVEEFRSKYDDKSDAYIAGYAFFYANYSCFNDKPGFYFESLYFRESYRKLGMGKLLFGTVSSIAADNGFVSVDGIIAVWNKKSYDFYINMGVEVFDEFRYGKLHGENLQKYADNKGKSEEESC